MVHATRPPEPASGPRRSHRGSSANAGHMNRNPANVFALTADWALGNPKGESWLARDSQPVPEAKVRIIEGDAATAPWSRGEMGFAFPVPQAAWPRGHCVCHVARGDGGTSSLKPATSPTPRVQHPLFARRPKAHSLLRSDMRARGPSEPHPQFPGPGPARRLLRDLRAVRRSAAADGLQGELHRV